MAKKQAGRSRGQIEEKGPGKFLVRVFLGRDVAGKRKYLSETVTGTKSDADKALTALQAKQDGGTVVAKTKVTLGDHLKKWIDGRQDIAEKTRMDYAHRMAKDLYTFPLSTKPLSSVTEDMLQAHVKTLKEIRKLSPRTIKYTFAVLNGALETAVSKGLIAKNPLRNVNLPKDDHREMEVLTAPQMQLFLERTSQGDVQRHALWTVLLTAGLRPQEACALKWDDISEDTGITITRALKKVGTSKWEVGEVKTKAGKRTIPVPMETYGALKAHRARQASEILKAPHGTYSNQGFVFASRKHTPGQFLDIGTVRRWWKLALASVVDSEGKALLPDLRLYDSRHSHITALLAANVHPKVAQERAGHSTINVTLDTYSHVLPSMQKEASLQIGALLFKKVGT